MSFRFARSSDKYFATIEHPVPPQPLVVVKIRPCDGLVFIEKKPGPFLKWLLIALWNGNKYL